MKTSKGPPIELPAASRLLPTTAIRMGGGSGGGLGAGVVMTKTAGALTDWTLTPSWDEASAAEVAVMEAAATSASADVPKRRRAVTRTLPALTESKTFDAAGWSARRAERKADASKDAASPAIVYVVETTE